MNESSDWPSYLYELIENLGLDPLYTLAIVANLITVLFWKHFKNWQTHSVSVKFYDVTYMFGLCIVNLFCLLRLIGVFDS